MTNPISANWQAGDGDWSDASDWIEANPNPPPSTVDDVPGADNAVQLSSTATTPYTITYEDTDEIYSLSSNSGVTLDITSGTLTIDNDSFVAGEIDVGSAASLVVNTGATLTFSAGTISGTLGGAGTIEFISGDFSLNSGASLDVANLILGVDSDGFGSTTTLNTSLVYAGTFTLADYNGNDAALDLNNETLTLTGSGTLDATVDGPGTLLIDSAAQVASGFALSINGGATVEDAGAFTQAGQVNINDGELLIDSGATYTVAASVAIQGQSQGDFTNNGTLTIDSGDTLTLDGTNNLGGTVSGDGELSIGPGATTIDTPNISVATLAFNGHNPGETTTLDVDLSYAGVFDYGGGFDVLDLNGNTLTLSGLSDELQSGTIDGGGNVKVTGGANVSGLSVGGDGGTASTIEDDGSITQDGNLSLNGELLIDSGKTYTITSTSNINIANNGAAIVNNGSFVDADSEHGTSDIANLANNSTLTVDSDDTLVVAGTNTLGGTLNGAGTLVIGSGTTTLSATSVTVGTLDFSGGINGATTTLGKNLTYAGVFSFGGEFDTLDLDGNTLTLSGTSDQLQGGVINGAGTLQVTGSASVGPISFGDSATLEDDGSIIQTGNLNLSGELLIDAGKTYTIAQTSNISGNSPAIVNNGTFTDADSEDGTSDIAGLTNNGTLTVDSGDTLVVAGTNTLGGTLNGAGTLVIGSGTTTLSATSVTVGTLDFSGGINGATTTLGKNLTYAGVFSFGGEFDTLDLDGNTLTLSGTSDQLQGGVINGAGTLQVTGSASVGPISFGDSATLEDDGSIIQTGNLNLSGELLIDAGKTYTIAQTSNISGNSPAIVNNGTFTDADSEDGTSDIAGLTNNGTLTVDSGDTLALNSSTTNNGTLNALGSLVVRGALAASTGGGAIDIGVNASAEFEDSVASDQTVTFTGASATALIDDPSQFSATVAGFAAGDTIDLTNIGYNSSYETEFFVTSTGGTLQVINTADNNSVVETLHLSGNYTDGLFTLASDGGGTDIGFTPGQGLGFGAGDVVFSNVSSQAYSAYEEVFDDGTFEGIDYVFTSVPNGAAYSSYEYDYSAGDDFIGSQFFYTSVPQGANYTGYEYDYDGGGNVTKVAFTGVTGTGYSSYEYDYVGGVFAGSKFEVTSMPQGASYSSYELDYDQNGNFTGDKFFFTDISGQSYTAEEEDFDSSGDITKAILSGFGGTTPYSSLELDYNAGTYEGYIATYAVSGQSFSDEAVAVNASNQITSVTYSGITNAPYSSVSETYVNGTLADTTYDFTDVTGASAYSYQEEENASGTPVQITYDNSDGSHALIGLANNQTLTSLGDDTMTGGGSGATFVLNAVYGNDTITDFSSYLSGASHDTLDVNGDFTSFASMIADARNVGANVVITAPNHDTLTIDNVTIAQLTTANTQTNGADFKFG